MSARVSSVITFTKPNLRGVIGVLALDDDYPAGGYPLSSNQLSEGYIPDPKFLIFEVLSSGHTFVYDYKAKLLAVWLAGSEVAGGTNLSAITVRYELTGRDPSAP